MNPDKNIARSIGILLMLHLVVGLTVPFILLHAVTGTRGFLLTAAENATQLRIAVFLLFAGSALSIAISIAVLPVLRRYSLSMSLGLIALATAAFSLQAVDCGRLFAMLSLSQEYANSGVGRTELFQTLAVVVGSARKWAHYAYLLVAVSWILLLFTTLFRFSLVPRLITALGIVASLMQITGVPLRVMMGYSPEMRLAMPLAPVYIALALWLLAKGFAEPEQHASETKCVADHAMM
jgi:hypothetical protein